MAYVFPICIGINRPAKLRKHWDRCVPYMHRDKPGAEIKPKSFEAVFPICIGINRIMRSYALEEDGVPYMHRDKPLKTVVSTESVRCSLYA